MCLQALVCLGLVLGNLALLVHLSEKAIRLRKSWKNHRLLVNNDPELKSVDPCLSTRQRRTWHQYAPLRIGPRSR